MEKISVSGVLAPPSDTLASKSSRIEAIDLVRGLVMVIMVLDHVRDFFHEFRQFDPTDLAKTTPILFFTRWITHYCAPIFVFLSGASAYLHGSRLPSRRDLSLFLLSRGFWLIVLELTVINFGWWFNVHFQTTLFQVIWAIGISMVCMAGIIHLPYSLMLALGLIIVFGHNLLDTLSFPPESGWYPVWSLIHQPALLRIGENHFILLAYPMLAWLGVMLVGYCLGRLYQQGWDADRRGKWLWRLGAAVLVLFVVIRTINLYGDPRHWTMQKNALFTVLSFLNTTKYPPSLLYILMTLGPCLLLLYWVEGKTSNLTKILVIFGKVPLFYYILHIYLIHIVAILTAISAGFTWNDFDFTASLGGMPAGFGYNLGRVYLIWFCIVAILYPPCKAYGRYKSEHRTTWWLSYL
jgi:uncharacterized membrane protein